MILFYQLSKSSQSRWYFFSKFLFLALIAVIWIKSINTLDQASHRLMLIAVLLSLASLVLWGVVFYGKEIHQRTAYWLGIIDVAILFGFVYPVNYLQGVFYVLPALLIVTSVFLLPRKQSQFIALSLLLALTVSTLVFTLLGLFISPLETYLSLLLLNGLIYFASYTMVETVASMQNQQKKLEEQKLYFQNKCNILQREHLLARQRLENLSKDVRKKDIEIKNIVTLSGQYTFGSDFRKALKSFLLTIIGQIGSEHAAVLTKEKKEHNFYKIIAEKGLRSVEYTGLRIYLDSNFIKLLDSTREPMLIKQIPREGLYDDEIRLLNLFSEDLICPLIIKKRLVGLLIVGNKLSGAGFTKEDINLVSIISNQAAFLMEQSQISEDFQEFYAKTIRSMLRALESKYVFARGHVIRTANYVNILSRKLGMNSEQVKEMTYGTLLHDVGKIAVRDEYLLNDQIFTEDENAIKKKILEHTLKGAAILNSAGFNETVVDLALHHHEFYNGHGFPHRIGENDLSAGARILAVCNTYDAMTSDRPHRKALPDQTAREYLQFNANKQYDPEIVKLFFNELENNKEMQRYH